MMEVKGMVWVTKYPKARAIRTDLSAQGQPTGALWAVMAKRSNRPPYWSLLWTSPGRQVKARYICVFCLYSFLEIWRVFVSEV